MKKTLMMILLPAMLCCGGIPKIEFDTLTHDFGKQAQNTHVKHRFMFTNTGSATLIVNKIEAG
ncbi:MAG: DUF1573 domain-containing protein [Candidatus Brocadiia bacterium]|nr:MAG: DUF1573 domain-containing protein [Candidatus Brocadiia bacterium]